jgi:hypothetical protein
MVAARDCIGDNLWKYGSKWTGVAAGSTGYATKIVPLDNAIFLFLQGFCWTGGSTGGLLTFPAGNSKFSQFTKVEDTIIKRMIKITAFRIASGTLPTEFKIDE